MNAPDPSLTATAVSSSSLNSAAAVGTRRSTQFDGGFDDPTMIPVIVFAGT